MIFQAPESLSEQIAQHLGLRIIRAQLKPKERIQELKIAKELDVSRGSVREALLILERRHLINIFPRKGAIVSELSSHHVNCIYDMYINLLTLLLTTFALAWKEGDLNEMLKKVDEINKLIKAKERPVDDIVDHGFELMTMTYSVINNQYLEETLENFKPAVSRTYHLAMKQRLAELTQTQQFFEDIVDSVYKRNTENIIKVVKNYGELQRSLVLQALEELDSPPLAPFLTV